MYNQNVGTNKKVTVDYSEMYDQELICQLWWLQNNNIHKLMIL